MHLPFLGADPDTRVDLNTRGAWTDEGLYSAQARNLVNGYGFELEENTTAVRGPLQVITQVPFLYVFGDNRIVVRLITLLFLLLSLIHICSSAYGKRLIYFFLLLGLLQFHVFQFSHYALAEMMAVSFILLGFSNLVRMQDRQYKGSFRALLFSGFMLAGAVAMKVQFAYILVILPMVFLLHLITSGKASRSLSLKLLYQSVVATLIPVFALAGLWILPAHRFFRMVMSIEVEGRFPSTFRHIWELMQFNWNQSLYIYEVWPLLLLTICALALIPMVFKKRGISSIPLLFGLSWLVLELHKLPMTYLPHRYLLGFYIAAALVVSLVFARLTEERNWGRYPVIVLAAVVGVLNISINAKAYARRSYELKEINTYIKSASTGEGVFLGAWAPSVSWGSGLRCLPVWNSYFPGINPMEAGGPTMVIAEFNEADSDAAWERRGIDLGAGALGVTDFKAWRYDLKVYLYRDE